MEAKTRPSEMVVVPFLCWVLWLSRRLSQPRGRSRRPIFGPFFLHSSADPPNKQSTRTRDKNKTIKKTFHASASRVPDQDRSIRFSGHLVVVFFFCSSTVGSNQQAAPSSVSSVGRASAEEKAFDDCFVDRLAEQFAFLATKRTRGAAGGSPSSDILFLSKEIFSQKKEKKKRKKMENLDAHPRAMKRTKV